MTINKLNILSIIFGVLLLASCSSEHNATSELLGRIPADATDIAVINPEACGLTDSKGASALGSLLETASSDPTMRKIVPEILTGNAGIDLDRLVLFNSADAFYFIGRVADDKKLADFAKKHTGKEFAEKEGVKICGSLAVLDDYFWISDSNISPATIKKFNSLDKKQSWLANNYADTLIDSEAGIEIITDSASALEWLIPDAGMQSASLGIALASVLSDLNYIAFSATFSKGSAQVNIHPLDSRYRPSEYILPAGAIDAAAIKKASLGGEVVLAIDLPAKLVDQLRGFAGMLGASAGLAGLDDLLNAADGTLAFAAANGSDGALMLTLSNPSRAQSAATALQSIFFRGKNPESKTTGSTLILGSNPASAAGLDLGALDGAAFGLAATGTYTGVKEIRSVSLDFRASDKSLTGRLIIKTTDPNAASLPLLFNAAASALKQTAPAEPSLDDDEEPLFDDDAQLDELEKMLMQ